MRHGTLHHLFRGPVFLMLEEIVRLAELCR
jgi:hypothetical protein